MESTEHAAARSPGRCIKLTVAYDGTNYQGWQRQPTGPTIQAALEAAINSITQEEVHISGSGRTDAGVHAWGQVASFHTKSTMPADVFRKALNATLPHDIVVRHACDVPTTFRPINDAISKRYRYVVQPGRINDPFSLKHAWFVKRVLDVEAMQSAAAVLIGEHDFAAFQATGSPRQSTVRTMLDATVEVHDADQRMKIFIEVEANGFLYNMVRIIAGTLVDIGQGKRTAESMAEIIASADRVQAGMTAPAHGLYLLQVHYPPHHGSSQKASDRMRVAHVITRMIIGGAQENTLYNCLDLIREFGDDVLLITGPSEGPEGNLLEQAHAQGVPVETLPNLVRNIHPVTDYRGYQEVKAAIKKFKPDVVHTHSAKGGMLGRRAATAMNVPAVIHTVHGAPFHPYQSALARKFFIACERYAASQCHQLVSVADAMTDLLVEAKVAPREKFVTVYSGMEVEPFLESRGLRDETRKQLGIQPSDVVIGKIARLFHLKGHEYVIEAAKQVVAKCPQAKFLFVGDGILREKFEGMIAEAGLTDRFILVGLVPPKEIPKYISAMDVLVHTSLREGLARALPQALLSGKPAVSFDIDGAREVVSSMETGFLIPPGDTAQLTSALIQLCDDPTLREKLGEEGRRRCIQVFPHQVMTRRLREIYLEVLHRNGCEAV